MSATGIAIEQGKRAPSRLDEKLTAGPGRVGVIVFALALGYAGSELVSDLSEARMASIFPYVLLFVALLVASGSHPAGVDPAPVRCPGSSRSSGREQILEQVVGS